MPGAQTSVTVARNPLTSQRKPRHLGQIWDMDGQFLRPFMMAPIRPGERLDSISIVGDIFQNSMINIVQAPLTYYEVGVWYIPLHAYGPDFANIFLTDAEDIAERGTGGADIAGAAGEAANLITQGHIGSGGYSVKNRPWAGEIANAADIGSTMVPWVSHGSYIVGDAYYGLETGLDFRAATLLDNPPLVSPFIRGASIQGHALGTGGIDPDPSAETSLTQMLESMYLLATPDRTMPEILGGFGVDARRASGMPVPLLIDQGMMMAQDNPQQLGVHAPNIQSVAVQDQAVDVGFAGDRFGSVVSAETGDPGIISTLRPMGNLHSRVSVNRQRGIRADTFGIILGTVVTYAPQGTQASFGHHMDGTRLLNLGHWGDPSFGGIEELDFVTVQDMYDRAGTGETSQRVMNLLNLYMHGDEFTEHGQNGASSFQYRSAGGDPLSEQNNSYTAKLSCQLNISTDMFG